ncbi:ATP-binding sensor histidine kinase [Bradyrhizobium sp. CCGUVB23]|uniref:trifunctional serine/threonine-protein kinase/ATP-binding protein/sensor histidine kinase n=1 Tax=Bradyrhizobium sp. CCGUVB23 TaxID=2949630 RepID=UPI0020B2BF5E|nr:ATP-binding sensor histidine kinase [Bradyrhizobium sp. CCGUVB23]MCP3463167.1 AAA family ATPase [Bradyrhizobium sp. CCGUVB23]
MLWQDVDRVLCRGVRRADRNCAAMLAVLPAAEHPAPAILDRLAHEYDLKDELDAAWAVRPLELVRERGRTMLLLEDPGGKPLAALLRGPFEVGQFLHLAISLATALGKVHEHELIHKDLNPANILVNCADGQVRFTGFGLASRLPRERQAPDPPEVIAGTLAYMAPEQTGRMNRSVDARSDLYALGVIFYQMLTGGLPFTAADPLEWVHCHVARQPVPPTERVPDLPAVLSVITMKLLAKAAEDRYQSVAGVESDLRRCLAAWEDQRRIENFVLGENDTPQRLSIPEKLYGREHEVASLLAAFDRVVKTGTPKLVLISGYSGIGKSSVVNELHKALVPPHGLFAGGKFDPLKRDIPYSTPAQAFQGLVKSLLSKSDGELASWREALCEALGPNGRLIVDLVPELRHIIGDQPPVPQLDPQDAQRRFQLVLRRFIGVFARQEHPLALFLDDLQWIDAATLDLIEDLLIGSDLQYLMLIGAYRDNEVDATHALTRKLAKIRQAGTLIQELNLLPLARDDVGQLIADGLRCEPVRAAPLAQLVGNKTAGNPFFVIQFLSALAEEGELRFEHDQARWSWDIDRIHAKGYTENVADLMVGKLSRLPGEAREALERLACLGNSAETTMLALVQGTSDEQVHAHLWEAVRQGFVERLQSTYRFAHDRVHEAAYSLIPNELRPKAHLQIGRQLLTHTPSDGREAAVFEIANQFNRAAPLLTSQGEREEVAKLNLTAAERAEASAAHASALTYLVAGAAMLDDHCWESQYALTFALEFRRAECEFLTGALAAAEERLSILCNHAKRLADHAAITQLRVELFTAVGRIDRAIEVGLDYLRRIGINWSAHPTWNEVQHELERIWRQIGDRQIEALLDLPRMTNPIACDTVEVLSALVSSAWYADQNLRCLVIGRMVNLTLEHGNSDASCMAYVWLGTVLGPQFADYAAGFRFGELGLKLMEQRGLARFKLRVHLIFGSMIYPWMRPIRTGRLLVRRALDEANQIGELASAAFSRTHLIRHLLAGGVSLEEVLSVGEAGLDFARGARFGQIVGRITALVQLIRTLRGLTPEFGCFDDSGFEEDQFARALEADPRLATVDSFYWVYKLQAHFFAGHYASAIEAASKAKRRLWTLSSHFESVEYHFFTALTHAALYDAASAADRPQHLEALLKHQCQLQQWADNCPENFENRAALVGAEVARLGGRDLDALHLYEQAIRSARTNGFIHNEALASELAARFYAARGFEIAARGYLRHARHGYLLWGAGGKVRQLDELHPHLRDDGAAPGPTNTIAASVEHLDLATVIKVSQAVSGEILLERLVDTVMRTAIEQAGAERGLLILCHGAQQRMAAEATTEGGMLTVDLLDGPVTKTALPEAILQHVLRTRASMLLDDAAAQAPFAADPYIQKRRARSVLCLPLLNQAKLTGVLYLENTLATRAFAPGRVAALKLLASQAAISLENTRLYRDLAKREAKIQRLVDANIIGIFIWKLDGRIMEANDAFLRIVGYERADLDWLSWRVLTPPEWLVRHDQQWTPELKQTGSTQPYEKEYFRKDGSRAPVMVGGAVFEQDGDEGVSFVLDLTERKRAEEAFREMQRALAHANRVATMGQFTASIAHEITQPIAAVDINASAALRWLAKDPPDLKSTRQSIEQIAGDAGRAVSIIDGLRNLVKKSVPRTDRFDISEAVREIAHLTRTEAMRNRVSIQTAFAGGSLPIEGDRVQLQQVMLNLIMNAIEAMSNIAEGSRELLISTSASHDGFALVAVQDSGPGLDPANLERVFEPFYSTKSSGLGLGLSICRSIIEAHRGRLWAVAGEPSGAIFQFTIPTRENGAIDSTSSADRVP